MDVAGARQRVTGQTPVPPHPGHRWPGEVLSRARTGQIGPLRAAEMTSPAGQCLHTARQAAVGAWAMARYEQVRAVPGGHGSYSCADGGRLASARSRRSGQLLHATILTTAAETDGRHDLTLATTPPGETTPLHQHTRYDERLWVISGSLTVWAGPDKVTLGSGDYYAIPMNTPHMIQTGPEGARALNISSPAGFAELLARTGTPARLATPHTELDTDLFMAVITELGDVVLGPPGTTPADLQTGPSAHGAA